MILNLYIVSVDACDYDEYDSVVVAAPDEVVARAMALIHLPLGHLVTVELIGTALPGQEPAVLHESFNAG